MQYIKIYIYTHKLTKLLKFNLKKPNFYCSIHKYFLNESMNNFTSLLRREEKNALKKMNNIKPGFRVTMLH